MKITVCKLIELDQTAREQAAQVFVNSYKKELGTISNDSDILFQLIINALLVEQFWVALIDGKVAGMLGLSTNKARSLRFDKRGLCRSVGGLKGRLIYPFLNREFHTPLSIGDDEGYIEAVATDPQYRGMGVATTLLRQAMNRTPHRIFTLEVVDTNATAIQLYEKRGFATFKIKKQRYFRKWAGFNARYYMRKVAQ